MPKIGIGRLLCRIGLHARPAVAEGTWPWPVAFTCPRCLGRFVDFGPAH